MKRYLSFLAIFLTYTQLSYANCNEVYCGNFMDACGIDTCWAPTTGSEFVTTAPCFSVPMLSRLHYRPIKPLVLLRYRQWDPCAPNIILGAQLRPAVFYGHTNHRDKFPYMGRFPGDFRGYDASFADVNDFTFSFTYSMMGWVHAHWEFLNSDQITFFGDPRQGPNQTQKIYALLGNLNCAPVYATIGKKDVAFGQMYTVNPYTPSLTWHYFGALAEGASVGYYKNGIYAEATILDGGRGIRVSDTNETGRLDNWALNASYELCCGKCYSLKFGAGYLYSTIYDGPFGEHEGPTSIGPRNDIYDLNFRIQYPRGWAYIEYASTMHRWLTTNHVVDTLSFGACYCFHDQWLHRPLVFSVDYGQGIQGPPSSEFHKNFQFIVGLDYRLRDNIRFSLEYIRAGGFVPLLDITDPDVSEQSTRENCIQLGLTLVI